MNKTENPAAFPWANDADKQYNWIHRGMTLRDYFAASALQGLLTSDDVDISYATALVCYRMADAMLKAREA